MDKSARVAEESERGLYDEQIGRGTAMASVPVPELIAIIDHDIRARFDSLTTEHQRFGYLDTLVQKLEGSVENWTKFYTATTILQEHKTYWESKGYATFSTYWRQTAGHIFDALQALESVYHYAQIASPGIFMWQENTDEPSDAAKQLSGIYITDQYRPRQIDRRRVFASLEEAKAYVWQALRWELASNRSFQYRIYRIKRDRPDVAARLLAGEYFRRLPSGLIGIDLIQAERDVFGAIRAHAAVSDTSARAAHRSSSQSSQPDGQIDSELDHVLTSAEQSEHIRLHVISRFKAVPWLVEALKQDTDHYAMTGDETNVQT